MKNQPPKPGHGGEVARADGDHERKGSKSLPPEVSRYALIGMVGFVVLALILAFALAPGYQLSIHKLEVKQLGDLQAALMEVAHDPTRTAQLQDEAVRDLRGAAFYEAILKRRVIEDRYLSKLVSLRTVTDTYAGKSWIEDSAGRMPADTCSYTGPVAGTLAELLARKGEVRVVLITFNSRNWNNYPDHGVIILWTDAAQAEFLPFEYFEEHYGITADEWADPAGKLFGKKAPFQFTYE